VAVPIAFHPDCLKRVQICRETGVDEIWCIGPNDLFASDIWSHRLKEVGRIRMVADGSGVYTKALGLETGYSNAGDSVLIHIDRGWSGEANESASD
jgi:peroxiredoxin